VEAIKTNSSSEVFKTSLYDLAGSVAHAFGSLEEIINDTEMQDAERDKALEQIMAELESSSESLESKIYGCVQAIKSAEADAKAAKAEKERLATKQSQHENKARWLRSYVLGALKMVKDKKLNNGIHSCLIKTTPNGKLEIFDDQILPLPKKRPDLYRIPPPELKKDAVKNAIKAGEIIPGCRLVDSESLLIK
jgi:hypothetical protein